MIGLLIISFSVKPLAVHAQGIPVGDSDTEAFTDADTVTNVVTTIQQVMDTLKMFGLDKIAYNLAQTLSQKLVSKALNSINGGASSDSNPKFITNFGQYFNNIGNQQTSKYLTSLTNDTNNPFAQTTAIAMTNSAAAGSSGQNELDNFTLNKIPGLTGSNWKAASTNISAAGASGWDFYSDLALPQNTPIGTAMIAQDNLANNIKNATSNAKTQLTSSGFLPSTKSASNSSASSGSGGENFGSDPDSDTITNPSQTNEDIANQSVAEPFQRLRGVNSLGQLVFSTIQQIATGLITKGISSLKSDLSKPQQQYGSPVDQQAALGTTTTTVNGVTTTTNNPNAGGWASGPQVVIDLRNELVPAIQLTNEDIAAIQQQVTILKQAAVGNVRPSRDANGNTTLSSCTAGSTGCVTEPIMALEECIPGPDTGWQSRLTTYVSNQLAPAQDASASNDDANTVAVKIVNEQVKIAIEEENQNISNPLLNIPGASQMNQALQAYYQNGHDITKTFDVLVLREQALSTLKAVESQVLATTTPSANNPNAQPLILFDDQWQAMSPAAQQAEYALLTPKIISSLPQYVDPTNSNALLALAPDDPTMTGTNQDMEKRVLDEQWLEWESSTSIPDSARQSIYAQYESVSQNVVDPTTLAGDIATTQAIKTEIADVIDTLHDCKTIENSLLTNPPTTFVGNTAAVNGLGLDSSSIKEALLTQPSILDAINNPTQNPVDWSTLNQITVPISQPVDTDTISNKNGVLDGFDPSIPAGGSIDLFAANGIPNDGVEGTATLQSSLPITSSTTSAQAVAALINQDSGENLYCRLDNYMLAYWMPDGMKGSPIGCGKTQNVQLVGIRQTGDNITPVIWKVVRNPDAQWYHTNPVSILFSATGNDNN